MKKILLFLPTFCIFVIFLAFIVNPTRYFELCKQGLIVWAFTLVPALIPFFFCSILLSKILDIKKLTRFFDPVCKLLYNQNGIGGYIQIMSFISGYPVGAKLILEFYNQNLLTKDEATKLSTFCSTSGPSFIIASIGAVTLKSSFLGFLLLLCHFLGAIINGIIFRKYCDYRPIAPLIEKNKSSNILYDCAFSTFSSCLLVGVFVAFFFAISQLILDLKIALPLEMFFTILFGDNKKATAFLAGLLECTKGCLLLGETVGILRLPLICALISFGGFSVIAQSLAFLKQVNANGKIFILSKAIQTLSSFLICLLICAIFQIK